MKIQVKVQIPEPFAELFHPWPFKIFHGGRGSAKSHSVASALVIRAIQGPERILCAREYQASIKDSVKQLLEDKIEDMGLSEMFISTRDEIRCLMTGAVFLFTGLRRDPNAKKSMERITICWVEEAQTTSQESLDILLPTIRAEGAEIWFTLNRNQKTDPVDKLFLGPDPYPDSIVREVNYDQNPFFPSTLKRQMEYDKAHDYEKYLHVWRGQPVAHSEALVFSKKWKIDNSIKPGEKDVLRFGGDWGFSQDPTALLRSWIDEEKREIYVDQEAYGVGVEIDEIPQLFDSIPGSRKWKITADSARPETISYLNRHGFKIKGAKKGAGSIVEGVEFLKSYTIVVHQRCKHLIDELSLYSYKTDKLTGEILPILVDKHNHMIDSLRYALEQVAFSHRARIHIG